MVWNRFYLSEHDGRHHNLSNAHRKLGKVREDPGPEAGLRGSQTQEKGSGPACMAGVPGACGPQPAKAQCMLGTCPGASFLEGLAAPTPGLKDISPEASDPGQCFHQGEALLIIQGSQVACKQLTY